jgi:hypothetical protein
MLRNWLASLNWLRDELGCELASKTALGFHFATAPFSRMYCNRDQWTCMDAGDPERIPIWVAAYWNRLAFRSSTDLVWGIRYLVVVLAQPKIFQVSIGTGVIPFETFCRTNPQPVRCSEVKSRGGATV